MNIICAPEGKKVNAGKYAFSLIHLNIHSLRKKRENIEILWNSEYINVDVLAFTEHWLGEEEISNYNIPNYNLISYYCRKIKKNGGHVFMSKQT